MKTLLVTNDFPPKLGGIQNYLWELWRRLPPDQTTVLTTSYKGAEEFDRQAPIRIERAGPVLLPTPLLRRRINHLANEVSADIIYFDPLLPVGFLGPSVTKRYGLVFHGAEVVIPGRLPLLKLILKRVLTRADHLIAAGDYSLNEMARLEPKRSKYSIIPPGVDTDRFQPITNSERIKTRKVYGVDVDAPLVTSVSRLVPRKGMDVLIRASARLTRRYPNLQVLIAGSGRDKNRLQKLIDSTGAPARLVGRVSDAELPSFYGCADVFAMVCRTRWSGLEQEGFGIVFVEAAACGVPSIAGNSGGAAEAVVDGETGLVVQNPRSVREVEQALNNLLSDPSKTRKLGETARKRAERDFSYDVLSGRLVEAMNSDR